MYVGSDAVQCVLPVGHVRDASGTTLTVAPATRFGPGAVCCTLGEWSAAAPGSVIRARAAPHAASTRSRRGPSMRSLASAQPIGDNARMSPIGYGLLLGFVLYLLLAGFGHWQLGFGAWFAVAFAVASVAGWIDNRSERPPPPGHCPCGYDLTGNTSGRCPECGAAVKGNSDAHT